MKKITERYLKVEFLDAFNRCISKVENESECIAKRDFEYLIEQLITIVDDNLTYESS